MSLVRIHIDKLVLRGIAPGDGKQLAAALQSELSRALGQPGARAAWPRSQGTPVVKLGQVAYTPGPAGSRALGRAIARGIRRRVGP